MIEPEKPTQEPVTVGSECNDLLGVRRYQELWDLANGNHEAQREMLELTQIRDAMEKLAALMEMQWGRGEQAGYRFPTLIPFLVVSNREECHVEDLWTSILSWGNGEPYA